MTLVGTGLGLYYGLVDRGIIENPNKVKIEGKLVRLLRSYTV